MIAFDLDIEWGGGREGGRRERKVREMGDIEKDFRTPSSLFFKDVLSRIGAEIIRKETLLLIDSAVADEA